MYHNLLIFSQLISAPAVATIVIPWQNVWTDSSTILVTAPRGTKETEGPLAKVRVLSADVCAAE